VQAGVGRHDDTVILTQLRTKELVPVTESDIDELKRGRFAAGNAENAGRPRAGPNRCVDGSTVYVAPGSAQSLWAPRAYYYRGGYTAVTKAGGW